MQTTSAPRNHSDPAAGHSGIHSVSMISSQYSSWMPTMVAPSPLAPNYAYPFTPMFTMPSVAPIDYSPLSTTSSSDLPISFGGTTPMTSPGTPTCFPSKENQKDTLTFGYKIPMHHDEGMGMGDQEKKKLERKRARNRQAASKCRQKKMDRIKELEDQVTNEKHRGQRLDAELVELQRALDNFRRVVERHAQVGCSTQSIRA